MRRKKLDEILADNSQNIPTRVLTTTSLRSLLQIAIQSWGAPNATTLKNLEENLINAGWERTTLESELYKPVQRLIHPSATALEIALSLRKGAYLSHATAVHLHALNDQIPKTVYVNHEQSSKTRAKTDLTQRGLDVAFARPQRTSKLSFKHSGHRIVLVNGKNTNRHGVVLMNLTDGVAVEVTNLARTLVDIVVRPAYAGGILQVFECYKAARSRVTGEEISGVLAHLDYSYPYEHSIGFLLERAGFEAEHTQAFRKRLTDLNFYLVYALREPLYDAAWRLFYPKGF